MSLRLRRSARRSSELHLNGHRRGERGTQLAGLAGADRGVQLGHRVQRCCDRGAEPCLCLLGGGDRRGQLGIRWLQRERRLRGSDRGGQRAEGLLRRARRATELRDRLLRGRGQGGELSLHVRGE